MMDAARPRINASMLAGHQGKNVCLLGTAHSPSQDGSAFQLTTSDKQDVTIRLQEPLQEYIDALVEVVGEVDARNNVLCQSYINFPPEISKNFDMNTYNKAVQLMAQYPDHYITGSPPAQETG